MLASHAHDATLASHAHDVTLASQSMHFYMIAWKCKTRLDYFSSINQEVLSILQEIGMPVMSAIFIFILFLGIQFDVSRLQTS